MRRVIAAMNMTIDGFCDHTLGVVDEEIHQHYADLLNQYDTILYGRITYQLMQYWQSILENPTGIKETDDFALAIDKIHKIVFSKTLKNLGWDSAKLASQDIEQEVLELKKQAGKDILVGSPSLIAALSQVKLIDEYQLCVHPVIAGSGLTLFKNISEQMTLKLIKTKTFGVGAVILYYEALKNDTNEE